MVPIPPWQQPTLALVDWQLGYRLFNLIKKDQIEAALGSVSERLPEVLKPPLSKIAFGILIDMEYPALVAKRPAYRKPI
ncbi:hypothetical protein AJ87_14025 [Rhizobium yanglingense]|nr:hypothetical protein AJ87_14025 [Rhizobium yanglingense]